MLQKRGAVGGDARSENVRWTFSAQNARPVGGPGDGRLVQHRAVHDRRVGAALVVLGTLWCNVPRRGSAGDAAKAPARGGGQALPGGLRP